MQYLLYNLKSGVSEWFGSLAELTARHNVLIKRHELQAYKLPYGIQGKQIKLELNYTCKYCGTRRLK